MNRITTTARDSRVRSLAGERIKPQTYTEGIIKPSVLIHGLERSWVELRAMITVINVALKCYGSFPKAWKAVNALKSINKIALGSRKKRRCVKIDGQYYFGIYIPAYPSKYFNAYIRTELHKAVPHSLSVNRLQIVQLAITNKCPLQCEHCFEWNNLNQEETFTTEELKNIILAFQQEGCTQFHFTGGEPLVRMKKLEELIRYAHPSSECWVLTSGINLTPDNALRLKNAGATGVIISLDHHDAAFHNAFRNSPLAYDWAMKAVKNANDVKLVTAFSICITRSFISEKNLMKYANLARTCGVSFVQMLEPKAVGHYEDKAVTLSKEHLAMLDAFYFKMNFDKKYSQYPVFIYHGNYQRKIGCLSGGNRALYIDSAGYINACPFCQMKNYKARDILIQDLKVDQIHLGGCSVYQPPLPQRKDAKFN